MVFLLILGGFPSQIKFNVILLIFSIKWFGTCRTEALKISLERPSVLTILIFSYNVSFLLCHALSDFSKSLILAPKLSSSASIWLCEKKTPKESIGSFGHLKPKGVSCLFFHCPKHIASVFAVLISRSEMELNSFRKLSSS